MAGSASSLVLAEASPASAEAAVGIGWRQPHYQSLLRERPALGFLEVHAENFFADGGAALAVLEAGRAQYPISLHGVGLGLGSAMGLDAWHLERLARLVERVDPLLVSDHACFARVPAWQSVGAAHAQDLLPIAFDRTSLDLLVSHVHQVQERLRRPLLVENLSAYLAWRTEPEQALSEPDFFNQLTARSGCSLLLDVNNLVVNARNQGAMPALAAEQAVAWLREIRPGSVGEIHLAGHAETAGLVIDDHGSAVRPEVWQVYEQALRHLGPVPSLIEWDNELPELSLLLEQADTARQIMRRCGRESRP